jgi:hypothetical protein
MFPLSQEVIDLCTSQHFLRFAGIFNGQNPQQNHRSGISLPAEYVPPSPVSIVSSNGLVNAASLAHFIHRESIDGTVASSPSQEYAWRDLAPPSTPPCLRIRPDGEVNGEVSSGESSGDESKDGDSVASATTPGRAKKQQIADLDPIMCPILAQPMSDAVVLVPCGHSFSEAGISQWLPQRSSCPTCRTEVICSLPNYSLRSLIRNLSLDLSEKASTPNPNLSSQ